MNQYPSLQQSMSINNIDYWSHGGQPIVIKKHLIVRQPVVIKKISRWDSLLLLKKHLMVRQPVVIKKNLTVRQPVAIKKTSNGETARCY